MNTDWDRDIISEDWYGIAFSGRVDVSSQQARSDESQYKHRARIITLDREVEIRLIQP